MYYPLLMSMDKQTETPLLLDQNPNSSLAVSFRKLRTAYNGSCIRVRRNSDNAEQDIPFLNGVLDTTSLLNFVGDNFCPNSEDISVVTWFKSNITIVNNEIIAPDGLLTADKLNETTATALHYVRRTQSGLINGFNYNISIYIKAGERNKCLFLSNLKGSTQQAYIDLTNGSVSQSTFDNPVIVTEVGTTGWYRVSSNVVSGVTFASNMIYVGLVNGSGSDNYTGDVTKGLYVWGGQFTINSTLKDYFKTTSNIAGVGFIRKFYGQSVILNDLEQSTTTLQPQITNASSSLSPFVFTDPNTGKIACLSNLKWFNLTNPIIPVQKMMHIEVFNRTSSTLFSIGLGFITTNNSSMMYWDNVGVLQSRWSSGNITHITDNLTGKFLITTLRDGSNVVKMYRNNIQLTNGTQNGNATSFNAVGRLVSALNTGYMSELVLWQEDLESSLNNIQQNVNDYYGIY